jgi:hypothetical protein
MQLKPISPRKLEVVFWVLCLCSGFNLFFTQVTQAKTPASHNVNPIFYESFETLDSIKANGGTYSNLTVAEGKSGKGAFLSDKANVVYPATNRIKYQKGTIEFWIKPNWDGRTDLGNPKYFLTIYEGTNFWTSPHRLSMPINAYSANLKQKIQNIFAPSFSYQGNSDRWLQSTEPFTIMKWEPGTWHKVTLFWDFSLPDNADGTHNSYMIAKLDDTYTTNKKVAPVGPDGFAPDARIILGQNHILGRYPADAVIDELKIYDHSLLPVVPFPEYQFNPAKPETMPNFLKLFANDGFASNFETYRTQPADCPKLSDAIKTSQKVLFFQRPAFEQVVENYVPKEAEINNQFNYQAPPGEFETLFFNVYSRVDLRDVVVTYTGFQGTAGAIPKANLDLRVVKNWFQAGRGYSTVADPLPVYVPELLLHNDKIPLDTDTTLSQFRVPSLPKLDHVETNIRQYTSRQFAMIVKVPSGTPAGVYSSNVTLSSPGISNQIITLNLEVLPFALKDTGKKYSITYGLGQSTIYAKRMGLDIWSVLQKDIQDIKDHGFNRVVFGSFNDAAQWNYYGGMPFLEVQRRKLAAAQQAGIKTAVIYAGVRPATMAQEITPMLRDLLLQHGFEPWMYGRDEVGDSTMAEHIAKSRLIHSVGGKVTTTTSMRFAATLADPNSPVYSAFPPGTYEPLQGVDYPICDDQYATDLMSGKVTKTPNRSEAYYWQNRDENPQTNRYYLGYFVWLTGLDGSSPQGYKGEIYNEFNWTNPNRRFREYGMVYASVQGPVPTFQGEATREGIKDGKYLATWKFYKDSAAKINPALAHQSEKVIDHILEHYRDRVPSVCPAAYRNTMAEYETDRKTLIQEIKKLISAKGAMATTQPTS